MAKFKVGDTVRQVQESEFGDEFNYFGECIVTGVFVDTISLNGDSRKCMISRFQLIEREEDKRYGLYKGVPTISGDNTFRVVRGGPTVPYRNDSKDTNPKDAVGITKPPLSTVSMPVLFEVGTGMAEGAMKYGRHNYRVAGVRASVYFDATMRHIASWWEGEDIDPDSGLSHVTKAICSLFVLRDAMINGMLADDRPPQSKDKWMISIKDKFDVVREKYPNPEQPHVRKNDTA